MNTGEFSKRAPAFLASLRKLLIVLTLVCACIGYGQKGYGQEDYEQENQLLILTEFERLYIDDRTSPPEDLSQGWQAVVLKELWPLRTRLQHREAWYRSRFKAEKIAANTALFIPRISANASIWINGEEIGNTGSFDEPLPRNWNHPVYFSVPRQLLNSGDNLLHIRLKTDIRRTGMLFEVSLGDASILRPIYNRSYFAKVTASKILTAALAVAVTIILVFYFSTQLPKSYLWFALGTGTWTLFSFGFFVKNPIVPDGLWDGARVIALFAATIFYTLTITEIFQLQRRKVLAVMYSCLGVIVLGLVIFPPALKAVFTIVSLYACQLILLVLALTLCWRARQKNITHRSLLLMTGGSVIFLLVYDWVVLSLQITAEFAKFQYIPLVIMVSGASVFIGRLIQREREHQDLQSHQVEIQNTVRAEALRDERQRLMQEIHDGVGGQLVSTLARLEKNRTVDTGVMQTLRTSIDDLRLIVHSLDNLTQYGDVITLLATIRERMEKSLNQQGIHMDWQVQVVPPIENFSSDHALQLLRIVQEAITNTIKHANANLISLRCYPQEKHQQAGIVIQIHDNGEGFSTDKSSVGLGLKNMRDRAAKLQGDISIQSDHSGTSIEVWIPLRQQLVDAGASGDRVVLN
jgi:signal transduction histidine kinase